MPHGATGVPAGCYRAFADGLAEERDLAVLTCDCRDFGASARGTLRRSRTTMTDRGRRVRVAALATPGDLPPGALRRVIGHSPGGAGACCRACTCPMSVDACLHPILAW